jgi:hypothetical protein
VHLEQIQLADPVRAADVNRAFQKVAAALEGDAASASSIVSLQTTPNKNAYTAGPTDEFVVVDASGGDFTVSLPAPKVKQALTIVSSAQTTNKVIVQRADGQPVSGQAKHVLTGYGAVAVVCTGTTWVKA